VTDIIKSGQTGPSKVLNNAPQSPKDVGNTYKPDSEKHIAKTLTESLKQGNQATYSRKGR
jgi:hypothetical protein